MPTVCHNQLTLRGPWARRRAWLDAQAGISPGFGATPGVEQVFTFAASVPVPSPVLNGPVEPDLSSQEASLRMLDDGGIGSGSAWCRLHWGTPDDVLETDLDIQEDAASLILRFPNAFTPPLAWLRASVRGWGDLDFEFTSQCPHRRVAGRVTARRGGWVERLEDLPLPDGSAAPEDLSLN